MQTRKRRGERGRGWLSCVVSALLVLSAFAVSCGDDEAGEPQFSYVGFDIQRTSTLEAEEGQPQFEDRSGTVYTLQEGFLAIEQIELELPNQETCRFIDDERIAPFECEFEFGVREGISFTSLELDETVLVDLQTGETVPSLQDTQVPELNYDDLEVTYDQFQRSEFNEDQSGLAEQMITADEARNERTVFARSNFEREGEQLEMLLDVLEIEKEAEVEFDEENAVDVQQGENLTLQIDLARILDGIPVTQCLDDGELSTQDGRVRVTTNTIEDAPSCSGETVQDMMKENLQAMTTMLATPAEE